MTNLDSEQFSEYHMAHRPTSVAGLHEAHEAYPDVYDHPEYYVTRGHRGSAEAHRSMVAARGNPDHPVNIYRAVPRNVPKGKEFNEGDWITTSRSYAQEHARSQGTAEEPMRVATHRALARHVGLTGDYLPEAGYHPNGVENEPARKEYRS